MKAHGLIEARTTIKTSRFQSNRNNLPGERAATRVTFAVKQCNNAPLNLVPSAIGDLAVVCHKMCCCLLLLFKIRNRLSLARHTAK